LKRKHWAKTEERQGGVQGNRLGKIAAAQLSGAQELQDGGNPSAKRQKFERKGKGVQKGGGQTIGVVQQAREKAVRTAKAVENAMLREQVVEAYRASKQGARQQAATMKSLKGLVARGQSAAAAASALS